jgi:hypothetical protein
LKHHDTNYSSGILYRPDTLLMKQWSNGVGVGVGGWIQPVTDDEWGLAEQLDGFRGRSFGTCSCSPGA